ncbi:hypothetical protein BIZ37_16555 [Photobacterium sp. BZF1]|uniref:hypothetical protein n=1 Tax=Photobacterium sp. BZF1 TaxID=1904457 RepID=UPI0016538BEA|nr:hypothetical protein [Photobacterium sp. BZF1]MBC7004176.1 hypothetical protein [Photobacterium sp. BZF1]
MKKLITVVLMSLVATGCSTAQSGLEKLPYYEPTPTEVKVEQTYQHAVTAQMMI